VADKPSDPNDELATAIAHMEKQLRAFEAAGGDRAMVDELKRELEAMRRVRADGQIFLRTEGSDSTVIGFTLPSETRRPDPGAGGAP
jgi:hypothetical protein